MQDQSRHTMLWRPYRCEVEGCTSKNLMSCSACKMVKYCSKEHQKIGWATHKHDCKKFQSYNLWAKFFDVEEQIEKNPENDLVLKGKVKECGICGASHRKLTKTNCCNNWVCDNSSDYEMFSYSRDYCERSHDKYTMCGQRSKNDWRFEQADQDSIWSYLNGYNFLPGLKVPYGAMTIECTICKGRILSCMEGFSVGFSDGGPQIKCVKCNSK